MEIIKTILESKNNLFKRTEVGVLVKSTATPTKQEAIKFISEKYKKPEDHIKINKIQGKFGTNNFMIDASVYDSVEELLSTEPKKKEKKGAQQ